MGIKNKDFERNSSGIHTLYISPLKALNNDIQRNLTKPLKEIQNIAAKSGIPDFEIRTLVRTGDTPPHLRQAMLTKPPHILITTPESLYLILNSEKGRQLFTNLRYVIVDEIHSITTNKRGVHLNLSLERLMPLCKKEPVRIGLSATQKPLQRIADFLGGYKWNGKNFVKRPVKILDCGQRKKMDLQVICPVEDLSELPEASVWPAVYKKLYDYITSHNTTLVFLNMRAQVEKTARKLNEMFQDKSDDPQAQLALPHHGSMSREMRYEVEEKLKQGRIPAVIATSSLELGIDIGSVDLVVHLEAPKSVSAGLQRVGRSGHLLKATSKGRIIPLYLADLDDAVALADSMKKGDIEEITIPHNCLDVLAQQIVAEVAAQSWQRKNLYSLFKQSHCYRDLTESSFNNVLEMLTGRYAETKLPALKPVINWDRINDHLNALPGSRLLANMNGGTIPDRGYYGVYLADSNTRLGEMEEEFVFESKAGDVFFLGNTEWRINAIMQDRLIVTPAESLKPRAPFWKGDLGYQNAATAEKVGAFRENLLQEIDKSEEVEHLAQKYSADEYIFSNLIRYFKKQKVSTRTVPTNSQLVVEYFYDTTDELHFVIHAPFGGRVNAAWAIVIAAHLESRLQTEVQYSFDDDGFIIRIRSTTEIPNIESLLHLPSTEIRTILTEKLASTPIFAIQFRYCAARALLLARSRPGKRIPLWLQRLRASDLYQSIKKYPDFPVLLETYRSCLEDLFDLNALQSVSRRISNGEITVKTIQTKAPSPMVSGLIFDFLSNQVYEMDRSRAPGQVALVSNDLLSEILSRENIPGIITQDIIEESRVRWQSLHPDYQARTAEELHLVIKKLGPINDQELKLRVRQSPESWLHSLHADGRILKAPNPYKGWIASENNSLYSKPQNMSSESKIIRQYLENEGPVLQSDIQYMILNADKSIQPILEKLLADRWLVKGQLIKDDPHTYWCQRDNFAELYRRAIGKQRRLMTAVDRSTYYRFILRWHHLIQQSKSESDLLVQYSGVQFPRYYLERELFQTRIQKKGNNSSDTEIQFQSLITKGQLVVISPLQKEGNESFCFFERGQGGTILQSTGLEKEEPASDEQSEIVLTFLKQNGISPYGDIEEGTGFSGTLLIKILRNLLFAGQITTDNYPAFIECLLPEKSDKLITSKRHQIKRRVQNQLLLKEGRWFLTSSYAVMGRKKTRQEIIEEQARLLLRRHGILVKEWYRRERGFVPWYEIFQTLKRLEWQGEILRGYFIDGLSGIQYALPEVY